MTVGVKTELNTLGTDPAKAKYRSVFLAMRADAKDFGGFTAYAALTGRNHQILADQVNPDGGKSPPPMSVLLEFIETAGATRTLNALAYLAHRTTVPLPDCGRDPVDAMHHFMRLSAKSGAATKCAAEALSDNNLSTQERHQLGLELDALIAAAADFRASLRG